MLVNPNASRILMPDGAFVAFMDPGSVSAPRGAPEKGYTRGERHCFLLPRFFATAALMAACPQIWSAPKVIRHA